MRSGLRCTAASCCFRLRHKFFARRVSESAGIAVAVLVVGVAVGGRGVLGGAFGLELGGVEDAVVAVGAYGEGLGVVLEGVGWRLGSLIDDGEFAALLEQIEGGIGADAMDAAGSYVAGDAEVADVRFVAHALEFADGDVVALVVATAAEGEVGDGAQNDHSGDNKFDRTFPLFV